MRPVRARKGRSHADTAWPSARSLTAWTRYEKAAFSAQLSLCGAGRAHGAAGRTQPALSCVRRILCVLVQPVYEFTRVEYCLITIMMVGGVMALELVNSSPERAVERPVPERYMTAGAVKDMAAGAVLACALPARCAACLFVLGHGGFCPHVALLSALARTGPGAGGHAGAGVPLYLWQKGRIDVADKNSVCGPCGQAECGKSPAF